MSRKGWGERLRKNQCDPAILTSSVETVEALIAARGSDEKIWGSMVKTTMQRRKPGFAESYYGYRSSKELVEDAQKHKLLRLVVRDEKSGNIRYGCLRLIKLEC